MFIFPRNWSLKALPLLCSIIKGVTYTKADLGTAHTVAMIPILRANNINKNKLNYDELVWIRKDKISPKQFLQPGDIIIATSSGSKNLVGKAASFFDNKLISCGAFCSILRPNHLIDQNFFKYFFQTQHYRRRISETSKGSNINNLRNQSFSMISIPVPPLAEQKRIVKKIEELFAVIDKNIQKLEHTQQALIQYRQSVLQQAFSGKLYKTTNWTDTTLQQVVDINPKTLIPKLADTESVSFLPMPSVQEESLNYVEKKALFSKVKKGYTKFHDNDVLFAKITPCMENGKGCIVHNLSHGIGFGSTEFHVLRCHKRTFPKFIYYFIIQRSFRAEAKNNMSGAVGQQRVPADFLKLHPIYLPSLPEQKAIVAKIETAFAAADKAEKAVLAALEQAKQLKQSILKRAFEGCLVPQDPNDKPVDLTQLTPKGKSK